jgi:fatty-acyl-CoA synthase
VREVSVVGMPDARWGEVVAAVLRLRPECTAPGTLELHQHCRALLAAYKTPAAWFFVDAFPSTSSGKIQKFALREQIRTGLLVPQPFEKPARIQPA